MSLAQICSGQGLFWYVRLNADGLQNLGSAVYQEGYAALLS